MGEQAWVGRSVHREATAEVLPKLEDLRLNRERILRFQDDEITPGLPRNHGRTVGYVIDKEGVVRYRFVEVDHKVRAGVLDLPSGESVPK